jgi:hypothetical protein
MLIVIDGKLEGVTEQIAEIQTSANMLSSKFNDVQIITSLIETLSMPIDDMKGTFQQIQNNIDNVPDIGNATDTLKNQIEKDGDHTRSKNSQSAETIINHLHMNESTQFGSNYFTTPQKARVFEEMERSMLCFSVEKIEIVLNFVRIMVIKNGKFITHITVSISRYLTLSLQLIS